MREQTPEERTQQWRSWANFVFLAGGPVPDLDDLHLQLRVVQAYDDAEYGRQAALEALAASWDRRDELHVVTKSLDAQLINMAVRCEALTAERDSWRRVAERLEGEKVESQTRCQHLEQAVRYVESYLEEQIHDAPAMTLDMYDHGAKMLLKRLREKATLASLLTPQDETPRTDENRVSFAAGYSQALDDQAKGLK